MHRTFRFVITASVAVLWAGIAGPFVDLAEHEVQAQERPQWHLPARSSVPAPAPVRPLPAALTSVPALTVTAELRAPGDAPGRAGVRTFLRTADRVVVAADGVREWHFVRNPRDASRVSASRVEHASRTIVEYEESDVRRLLGIDGWAGIVALGFDVSRLDRATRTAPTRRVGSVTFTRYEAEGSAFWWSAEAGLATDFDGVSPEGRLRVAVTSIDGGVDADRLRHPHQRHPGYRVMDVSEWLESPPAEGAMRTRAAGRSSSH